MLLLAGRRARRRIVLLGVAIVAVIAAVAMNLRLFVWPAVDPVVPADAVVVLAGGSGERLDRGLELMHDGVAPTIAVSFGPDQLCNTSQPFAVVCFRPSPENTRGEAEAVSRLAREHEWNRVVLVTTTSHVTRARLLMERCYDGNLGVVGATPRKSISAWLGSIMHEWGGLAEAFVSRDC